MNATKKIGQTRAIKISERQWGYRGGLIEFYGAHRGYQRASWSWDCCGVSGFVGTKKDAKAKIDELLRQAAAILQSE